MWPWVNVKNFANLEGIEPDHEDNIFNMVIKCIFFLKGKHIGIQKINEIKIYSVDKIFIFSSEKN